MKYAITHRTTYRYGSPVDLADHVLHLTPRSCEGQTVLSSELFCTPAPSRRNGRIDHFGNHADHLSIEDPHSLFTLVAKCRVDVHFPTPPPPDRSRPWEQVRDALRDDGFPACLEAAECTFDSPLVSVDEEARRYGELSFPPGRPILEAVLDLTHRIHRDFSFRPGTTAIATPVIDVLCHRTGVCQDFAHVQIACLRAMGLAGRYVSGYLRTHPPAGESRRRGTDVSHAWVSTWSPDFGWIHLDPTNDLIAAEEHVVLAWGRDYSDVSPVRGVLLGGGVHTLDVAVQMDEVS